MTVCLLSLAAAAMGQDKTSINNGTLDAARSMEASLNNCLAVRDTLDGLLITLAAARKNDDAKGIKSILMKTEACLWTMKSRTPMDLKFD